jgi:hypothetical protein
VKFEFGSIACTGASTLCCLSYVQMSLCGAQMLHKNPIIPAGCIMAPPWLGTRDRRYGGFSELRLLGILRSSSLRSSPKSAAAKPRPNTHERTGLTSVSSGYYLDFLIIYPSEAACRMGAPGRIGPRLCATHRLVSMVNNI